MVRAPAHGRDGGDGFELAGRGFADHGDVAVAAVGAERNSRRRRRRRPGPAPIAGVASTLPAAGSLTITILLSQTEIEDRSSG